MCDGVVFIDLSYELLVTMFQLCAVGLHQATLSINCVRPCQGKILTSNMAIGQLNRQ